MNTIILQHPLPRQRKRGEVDEGMGKRHGREAWGEVDEGSAHLVSSSCCSLCLSLGDGRGTWLRHVINTLIVWICFSRSCSCWHDRGRGESAEEERWIPCGLGALLQPTSA